MKLMQTFIRNNEEFGQGGRQSERKSSFSLWKGRKPGWHLKISCRAMYSMGKREQNKWSFLDSKVNQKELASAWTRQPDRPQ